MPARLAVLALLLFTPAASAAPVIRVVHADETGATIQRIDSSTLEQQAGGVQLPFMPMGYDAAPDGSGYALLGGGNRHVVLVDRRAWRVTATVELDAAVHSVAWIAPRRVLAVTTTAPDVEAAVHVIDAEAGTVVARHPMDHTPVATHRVGHRLAVVEQDARISPVDRDPVRIRFFGRAGKPGPVVPVRDAVPIMDLTARDGRLLAVAEGWWASYDPATGRARRHPFPYTGQYPAWLSAGRRTLALSGLYSGPGQTIVTRASTIDRSTGRVRHRGRVPATSIGIPGGFAAYDCCGDERGVTAFTRKVRRRWTALRGRPLGDYQRPQAIGTRLFVFGKDGTAFALDARTGRLDGRLDPTIGGDLTQILVPTRGNARFDVEDYDDNDE